MTLEQDNLVLQNENGYNGIYMAEELSGLQKAYENAEKIKKELRNKGLPNKPKEPGGWFVPDEPIDPLDTLEDIRKEAETPTPIQGEDPFQKPGDFVPESAEATTKKGSFETPRPKEQEEGEKAKPETEDKKDFGDLSFLGKHQAQVEEILNHPENYAQEKVKQTRAQLDYLIYAKDFLNTERKKTNPSKKRLEKGEQAYQANLDALIDKLPGQSVAGKTERFIPPKPDESVRVGEPPKIEDDTVEHASNKGRANIPEPTEDVPEEQTPKPGVGKKAGIPESPETRVAAIPEPDVSEEDTVKHIPEKDRANIPEPTEDVPEEQTPKPGVGKKAGIPESPETVEPSAKAAAEEKARQKRQERLKKIFYPEYLIGNLIGKGKKRFFGRS